MQVMPLVCVAQLFWDYAQSERSKGGWQWF